MDDKRADYYDLNEINRMQEFIDEYEYTMDEVEKLVQYLGNVVGDTSLHETIDLLPEYITVQEGKRYSDYKDILEDFEDFNINDYNDNDGINQEYLNDIYGGLKWKKR